MGPLLSPGNLRRSGDIRSSERRTARTRGSPTPVPPITRGQYPLDYPGDVSIHEVANRRSPVTDADLAEFNQLRQEWEHYRDRRLSYRGASGWCRLAIIAEEESVMLRRVRPTSTMDRRIRLPRGRRSKLSNAALGTEYRLVSSFMTATAVMAPLSIVACVMLVLPRFARHSDRLEPTPSPSAG